jgi:hypothetical protein
MKYTLGTNEKGYDCESLTRCFADFLQSVALIEPSSINIKMRQVEFEGDVKDNHIRRLIHVNGPVTTFND